MLYNLTREERETIMNTTEADNYWDIYTDVPKYQRRLKKYAEVYPQWCELVREDPELGATTWRVDKKHCDFKLKKPRSDEYIQSLRERALTIDNPRFRGKKQSKS